MGKASLEVRMQFPKYFNAIQDALPRIEQLIASTIQTQVGLRFDAEGAHNGHEKWEALKMRQGQILSFTGALRKSMSPPGAEGNPGPGGFVNKEGNVFDLLVEVGSKIIYASVHDKGAVIRPKSKKALRFLNPGSGKFVFAKEVTIPKRPFTDVNEQDKNELEESIANLLAEVLEHA